MSNTSSEAHLARRLGLFDTTMLVMGGIIGSGIFINPYVVAQQVPSKVLILGAWLFGGLIALAGAFIYAELSSQTSASGGQYLYLRDAFHPALAFVYGWALLLVTQSGGMAAVAVTFAKYLCALGNFETNDNIATLLATITLGLLTIINCFGVRAGTTTQNIFMVLKLLAIAALVAFGLTVSGPSSTSMTRSTLLRSEPDWHLGYGGQASPAPTVWNSLTAFGAALIPVQFAYGGWQTSCFVAGETRDPKRNLPRGLLLGVLGVIVVYLLVNFVCVHTLGPAGLAQTRTPASAVMRLALGETGARIIAVGIAVSTIGFLSQSMLTAPRVYFAMAEDGLFFSSLAKLNRARVPAFAIALQGALAIVITLSGRYEQILNYVISVDVIFFALTAATVFVFRSRVRAGLALNRSESVFHIPGHPFTTLFFIVACGGVAFSTVYRYPHNSAIGLGMMLTGIPVYLFWRIKKTQNTQRRTPNAE
ncbi:MAG TPA: amino acid permease [Chthoniobacterales bacterium]|nr:amino acid permease [Chthoniobacterales bacterium]